MRPKLLVEVAGYVAAIGMRAGSHAGVDQDDVFRGLEEEHSVVKLELPVFQGVLVIRPGGVGDVREHRRGLARGRNHVDDGGNLNVANGCFVCHGEIPPEYAANGACGLFVDFECNQ